MFLVAAAGSPLVYSERTALKHTTVLLAISLTLLLIVAACGGGDGDGSDSPATDDSAFDGTATVGPICPVEPCETLSDDTGIGAPAGLDGGVEGLVQWLREVGATVEIGGPIAQDFFSLPGQTVTVNGADLQVYAYVSDVRVRGDGHS
jgi:hypothetical protein